jgi:hypothetical protein
MARKLSLKDLIARLETPGWHLVTGESDKSKPDTGTLKDVLEETHQRHQRREAPGFIKQVETSVELDLIQIQQLWQHLGLPTV